MLNPEPSDQNGARRVLNPGPSAQNGVRRVLNPELSAQNEILQLKIHNPLFKMGFAGC